ncbi:MAG: hypothetical protein ACHP7N_06230 [Caulobacterales bacterium]
MRLSTAGAAAAFAEDMEYLRELARRDKSSRAELRRASAVLRRLLVDNDLTQVAAPRIGKVLLRAPDNQHIYKAARGRELAFFSSAGVSVLGIEIRASMAHYSGHRLPLGEFKPDQKIDLRVDNFLAQRVLCLRNHWISRRAIIKYLANVASGVHSAAPDDDEERAIADVRRVAKYQVVEGNVSIMIDTFALNVPKLSDGLVFDAHAMDPALIELLATIQCLVDSPDVLALEDHIRESG